MSDKTIKKIIYDIYLNISGFVSSYKDEYVKDCFVVDDKNETFMMKTKSMYNALQQVRKDLKLYKQIITLDNDIMYKKNISKYYEFNIYIRQSVDLKHYRMIINNILKTENNIDKKYIDIINEIGLIYMKFIILSDQINIESEIIKDVSIKYIPKIFLINELLYYDEIIKRFMNIIIFIDVILNNDNKIVNTLSKQI